MATMVNPRMNDCNSIHFAAAQELQQAWWDRCKRQTLVNFATWQLESTGSLKKDPPCFLKTIQIYWDPTKLWLCRILSKSVVESFPVVVKHLASRLHDFRMRNQRPAIRSHKFLHVFWLYRIWIISSFFFQLRNCKGLVCSISSQWDYGWLRYQVKRSTNLSPCVSKTRIDSHRPPPNSFSSVSLPAIHLSVKTDITIYDDDE